MKTKYKTINITSIKGIEEAEKLKNNNWVIYSSSLFTIKFYKKS